MLLKSSLEKIRAKSVRSLESGENQIVSLSKASTLKSSGSVIMSLYVETPDGNTAAKRRSYPIHLSNAGLYDSKARKAVRVRYGFHP